MTWIKKKEHENRKHHCGSDIANNSRVYCLENV